jgi:hypothetical protein
VRMPQLVRREPSPHARFARGAFAARRGRRWLARRGRGSGRR